ncbi:6326_t:CDS:2 [Ambispora leptoticha]|uniref:RING-type E3 ubiquitin transferase n=1 Tax=Ambispora leptoticha TaxID=144679 RepID=A0A9N9EDZ3_9GLOM|nr:6326_t:CDS:2 [Ambispora leptoticha]
MFIIAKTPFSNKEAIIEAIPSQDIAEIRSLISQELGSIEFPVDRLRLFYGGKQLEDCNTVHEYDIKNKHTIQVTLKALPVQEEAASSSFMSIDEPASQETVASSSLSFVSEIGTSINENVPAFEEEVYYCEACNNNNRKKCKECGCHRCGKKNDEERTIVCDECQYIYHWYCLDPVITELPADSWFCEFCVHDDEEILTAGKKLDLSKSKKSKMPSATQEKNWGRGMACVGREKECTIVGPTFRGKIPGVPVGSSWLYRINCSESGIHRPPVAGIAGGAATGAVSIALSGGYPEDEDNGDTFTYTGAGGRDLKTGNKRMAKQTLDQKLDKTNLALARTCDAPISENGATANDWRKSLQIRVVRGEKLKKHNSKYAPEQGYRYDGIYKLVKYWKEKGSSGFYVWRYLMRRDDDEPAPWTKEGKALIEKLGLEMYVPEAIQKKRMKNQHDDDDKDQDEELASSSSPPKPKKLKKRYTPSKDLKALIKKDKKNVRAWKTVLEAETYTESEFIEAIQREFCCAVCQDLAQQPVTTKCVHNFCKTCLVRAMKYNNDTCPTCRQDIQEKEVVNQALVNAIKFVIPQYDEPEVPKKSIKKATRTTKDA